MSPVLDFRIDDLSGEAMLDLLHQHLKLMHEVTPPETIHALNLDGLKAPGVTVWSVWDGDALVGCGALKELDPARGEVEFMHTLSARRGQGIGQAMLRHIMDEARARGYRRLSLETGAQDAFRPARTLYQAHGFAPCPPFGDYSPDPNSAFMTLKLA